MQQPPGGSWEDDVQSWTVGDYSGGLIDSHHSGKSHTQKTEARRGPQVGHLFFLMELWAGRACCPPSCHSLWSLLFQRKVNIRLLDVLLFVADAAGGAEDK